MVKVAVLALHGMGTGDQQVFAGFETRLQNKLMSMGIEADEYSYLGFKYSNIFEERADKVFEHMEGLKFMRMRRFVTHFLGDALAYQKEAGGETRINYYKQIHEMLEQQITSWRAEIGEDVPLILVAHSLGAYIISNYVWDHQKYDKLDTNFENMETICSFITMGCNIPILTLAFDFDRLYPINIPGQALDDRKEYTWQNFYSKDDPLSMPLKEFYSHLTSDQQRTIDKIKDKQVRIGPFLKRGTPFSHAYYWVDKKMVEAVAIQVDRVLKVIED